ncbi:DUF397 domain-containing protein [Actinoallomurus sp. NPDC052274]
MSWRKSRRSNTEGNQCVEVAELMDIRMEERPATGSSS